MLTLTQRDSRLIGSAVLILAIIAVAVLSTFDGRRVRGTATPITFPPPPQLGGCALPPFAADLTISGSPIEIPVTALQFGPCEGSVVGEIVAVQNHSGGRGVSTAGTPAATPAPCLGSADGFAGLQASTRSATLQGDPTDGPARWTPTVGANTYLVIPGNVERAAGHDWTACISVPTGDRPYQGRLRGAYTTGVLPDQFGLCWAGTDLDESPTMLPCDGPHAAELLATGWVENRSLITLPDVDASCLDIASRIMKTDDPTHGGAISIVLDPVRRDGAIDPGAPLAVGCFATATGGRQLNHTVIGLAGSPVPLAG